MQIKVKYFDPELIPIELNVKGDWIDLRSAEDIHLTKGEFAYIRLGIAMKLPDGYEAHIVPRSSTFKKFGIIQANHQAVIDNSYCGDNDQWFFPAVALRDTNIKKNDRICQFRIIQKQPDFIIVTVDHLDDPDRGGLGSTGHR